MNTPPKDLQMVKASWQWPPPASSKPAHTVEYRRPLMTVGLIAGWLAVALMMAGCSKPAAKDPRLQPPTVEVFKVEAAGSNGRAFTGVVEARVQSDLGFRVGGKILERSVDVGQRVHKGQV